MKRRALSGLNAVTHMQSDAGLFRTHFYDTRKKEVKDPATAPNWYSQHLYTVCHLLESLPVFPEIAPAGESHILGFSTSPRDVRHAPGSVRYATALPAEVTLKLSFAPQAVQLAGRSLPQGPAGEGWTYDSATGVLTIRHAAGEVKVAR